MEMGSSSMSINDFLSLIKVITNESNNALEKLEHQITIKILNRDQL